MEQQDTQDDPGNHHQEQKELKEWDGDFDPFGDAEERRVLFAALDSFRYELTKIEAPLSS